jgi:hypothetical protein
MCLGVDFIVEEFHVMEFIGVRQVLKLVVFDETKLTM